MAKMLCWEEKDNGKYCKNYRLKHKDKCYVHYEYDEDDIYLYFLTRFICTILLTCLSYNVYMDNKEYFDSNFLEDLHIVLENMKHYLLQLYKVDKNVLIIHVKNFGMLLMRCYSIISMYISKNAIN